MGMFDDITSQIELPAPKNKKLPPELTPPNKAGYQTKDTPDQTLSRFRISKSGQLQRRKSFGFTTKGKAISKAIKKPTISQIMDSMPKYTETSHRWYPVNFTGMIKFYTSFTNPKKTTWEEQIEGQTIYLHSHQTGWLEYRASFVRGNLSPSGVVLDKYTEARKYTTRQLDNQRAAIAEWQQKLKQFRIQEKRRANKLAKIQKLKKKTARK